MLRKTLAIASLMMFTFVGNAIAQSPTQIGVYDKWGAYSYKTANNTVCYVLSVPTKMEPASVNHGDNYFLISQRVGKAGSFEPQFMAGYELKADSKVTVSVDGKNFSLFTKEKSAWIAEPAMEAQMVAAMRSGSNMVVKAISKRGTATTYTYSLKGITASLNAAKGKCGG